VAPIFLAALCGPHNPEFPPRPDLAMFTPRKVGTQETRLPSLSPSLLACTLSLPSNHCLAPLGSIRCSITDNKPAVTAKALGSWDGGPGREKEPKRPQWLLGGVAKDWGH
jgi:hypothetical protein